MITKQFLGWQSVAHDQKSCRQPCFNLKFFEKIHCNKIFCRLDCCYESQWLEKLWVFQWWMVNGTKLNFGKIWYKGQLRVIFDQWPKLHLGLDAIINQKLLKGIYCISRLLDYFSVAKVAYLLLFTNYSASTLVSWLTVLYPNWKKEYNISWTRVEKWFFESH